MFDHVQTTMSGLENYRMAMNIIKTWHIYRMPIIYLFCALLVLTVILFALKNYWKKWALLITLLVGLKIVALEGFTMYVEHKKKEAIKSALNVPITEAGKIIDSKISFIK